MSACQGTGALASRTRQKSKPQQEHGLPLQGQSDETTRAFWQTARPPRVAAALGQGKELRRHPLPPPPPNTPCRGAQQPRQAVVAERQPYLRPGSRAKKKRKTERPAWRGSLRVVTRGRGSIPQHYNTHSLSTPPQPPPTPPTPSRSNTRFVRGHLLRTVRRGRQTQTRGVARRHARNRTAAQCRRLGRGEGGPGRGVNKGNGEGGGGRRGWMGGETVRRN